MHARHDANSEVETPVKDQKFVRIVSEDPIPSKLQLFGAIVSEVRWGKVAFMLRK